jgi:outer membrane receptor protein involved in Fe transport
MRRALLPFIILCLAFTISSAQTSLEGKVTDAGSGEPILFGSVALFKEGVLITGTETDLDGNYFFSDMQPGTYDVEASYVGYQAVREVGVVVKAGRTNRLNFDIAEGVLLDIGAVIKDYKAPLIEIDNTTSGGTVTAEKIRNLPTKNINALAATTAGLSSIDGGAINIRGSRSNATDYYIDGVRVSGLLPESEIDQMQVITGGIEAKYGDVTGGIISITTKGPSAKFSGGIEVESSEFVDPYGYNQFRGNVSGPIVKNSRGASILGFRLSGQFQHRADTGPSAVGVYRLNETKIAELEETPITQILGTPFPTAYTLTDADMGKPLDARPNQGVEDIDLTGKLDFRVNSNIDLSISGTYNKGKNRFAPSGAWALMNWTNNPYSYDWRYRGNVRFRHRLGRQSSGPKLSADDQARSLSVIRNASYTLQFAYEKSFSRTEDLHHEENLFRYGYFGFQGREWNPVPSLIQDPDNYHGDPRFDLDGRAWGHLAYQEQEQDFIPNFQREGVLNDQTNINDVNAVLSKFNDRNGFLDGTLNGVWGLWSNVGQVYNSFSKGESDRITANISAGFDFLPGGSEKGRHSIQFGFTYEQRVNRGWGVNPRGLWTLMRLNANGHIIGVDTTNQIGTFTYDDPFDVFGGSVDFPLYQTLIDADDNLLFYQKIREKTGQSINDYVNIDQISPDDLDLDMFSAGELNDFGILGYRGYDYLGNKNSTDVKFDDFFTATEDGRRTFPVAADQPIYGAAYIQDKFSYKDIIFRVGLRVDYFDANTKVLKDPYSLYEIESAGGNTGFYARTGQIQPDAVDDDYKVYIAGEGSEQVVALREGNNWFLPNGTSVSDGSVIFQGGVVTPALQARAQGVDPRIQSPDFNTDFSFEDYSTQVNFMPRLAFSFPISEDAGFFAHYDILVQRPPGNNVASPLTYFYFADIGRLNPDGNPANNPALKPEKTIDYEVGFQQKLSDNSALKVSAYYKELRDMIQARVFNNTFPVTSYETYDNLDFGTVKGFSFGYDMRRVNNIEFSMNYTLQFADGSGSSANSSRGINSRGVIRTLTPLSFDERHRINAIIDYRFGEGRRYNGPTIGGSNIFANTGVNLQITSASGRPYTKTRTVSSFGGSGFRGGINEARLPWNFTVDLRADKRFKLFNGKGQRPLYFNVYVRVQNVFDQKNVRGVYSFSGNPEDDGYLISTFGEDQITQAESLGFDPNLFITSYQWALLSPGNFTLPRRIFVGAIVEF